MSLQNDGLGTIVKTLLGNAHMASVTSLAEVPNSSSDLVFVHSVRDFFSYRADSSRPVDGIEVLNGRNGTGRYERLNVPHPSWAMEPEFYVDPTNGSDENLGTTSNLPVRTMAEVLRRLGRFYRLQTQQTIFILDDCDEDVSWEVFISGGTYLRIQGAQIEQFSGQLTAVTNMAAASNTPTAATADGWTVEDEMYRLVHNQSTGALGWIVKDNGGGSARLTNMVAVDESILSTSVNPTTVNNAVGNTITTNTQRVLSGIWNIRTQGTSFNPQIFLSFNNFEISGDTSWTISADGIFGFQNCFIKTMPTTLGSMFRFINCLIQVTSSTISTNSGPCKWSIVSGGLVYGNTNHFILNNYADITLSGHCLVQGTSLRCASGSLSLSNACVFDAPGTGSINAGVYVDGRGILYTSSTVWGNNNSGFGIRLLKGARMTVFSSAVLRITGTSGDLAFGSSITTAPAYDTGTGAYTEPRTLNWANFDLAVSSGGFGGTINDPSTGCLVAR